ncbi:hypothetical protein D3C87_1965800 [compost metagenome]
MGKTLVGEDFQSGFGMGVGLADHRLGLFGQQAGIERLARHQFGDEGFVAQF